MNKYQLVFPIITILCAGMLPTYSCISPLIEPLPLSWYLYFSPQNSHVSGNQSSALSSEPGEPIRLAPKPKRRKQHHHNILLDDRGFPDQSDEFDYLLHNVDARPVLRKLLHPAPALDGPVDPAFESVFDPAVHESIMREDLGFGLVPPCARCPGAGV